MKYLLLNIHVRTAVRKEVGTVFPIHINNKTQAVLLGEFLENAEPETPLQWSAISELHS